MIRNFKNPKPKLEGTKVVGKIDLGAKKSEVKNFEKTQKVEESQPEEKSQEVKETLNVDAEVSAVESSTESKVPKETAKPKEVDPALLLQEQALGQKSHPDQQKNDHNFFSHQPVNDSRRKRGGPSQEQKEGGQAGMQKLWMSSEKRVFQSALGIC